MVLLLLQKDWFNSRDHENSVGAVSRHGIDQLMTTTEKREVVSIAQHILDAKVAVISRSAVFHLVVTMIGRFCRRIPTATAS